MTDDPGGASMKRDGGRGPLLIAPAPAPTQPTPSGPPGEGSPYPKAELLPRLLARLFDLMVCGALIALMHRAGAAAATLYLLLGDALFRGQSLGKKMLGIRVVHVPTRKGAGARQSVIRNFPLATLGLVAAGAGTEWKITVAFSLAALGYESLRVLIHPLGLRITDELAKTQVVDAKVVAGAPALAGAAASRPATGGFDRYNRRPLWERPPGRDRPMHRCKGRSRPGGRSHNMELLRLSK